jgi:hypothetical protein
MKHRTLRSHFITILSAYERYITTYGHSPEGVIQNEPRGVFRGRLEKLVANPENGTGPVFQNALPETVMAVLRNSPGPFRRSLWLLFKTTPSRCGGRSGRSTKRPHPVSAVVLVVIQNDPGPFRRSFWSLYRTTPARFGGRYGRSEKRPSPVSEVALVVIQNDPHLFWRSFW